MRTPSSRPAATAGSPLQLLSSPSMLPLALTLLLLLHACPARADSGTVWATPHASYSSSVGVLGCKVNTNRIAYWPSSVNCTALCVKLSYAGRSVNLLKVDQSGGAYDCSYDAWNYLVTGHAATAQPTAGGAVAMQYEDVDASECADLIITADSKLPLSAANSMDFVSACLEDEGSWVASNYVLYNILDPVCEWGYDELCELTNWPDQNQPSCKHTLGDPVSLADCPVYNVLYPSGEVQEASTGDMVSNTTGTTGNDTPGTTGTSASQGAMASKAPGPGWVAGWVIGAVVLALGQVMVLE